MRNLILLALTACFILSLGAETSAGTKRALLIGIQDYNNSGLQSLKGPDNDLKLVKQLLLDKFEFQEKNISTLMDSQASHTGLGKAFSDFAKLVEEGDFVYIHYSGHGSQTLDQNGDEHPQEYDQTWVSYGSRCADAKGKDQYDILDDELYEWLIPIFEKTEHVVFVSDSCHSASITRGEGSTVRGAPLDNREYPFGKKPFKRPDFKNGIRIGAVQDIGNSYEDSFDDGKIYGVFTWFWGEVLQQTQPGDTWSDVFKRVSAKVIDRFNFQHPQIQGQIDSTVFGEEFKNMSPRIPISSVWEKGKKVLINVGSLSGITAGSVFRLYNPQEKDNAKLPTLEITKVYPFTSEAKVKNGGEFKIGDLVVEDSHAYHFKPIPVFINADDPKGEDKEVITRVRNLFTGEIPELPGYRLTNKQQECELVLYVLRPKKENEVFIKKNPGDTLPQSFPKQPPEVWVLNKAERPVYYDLHISFHDPQKGSELLVTNLNKIIRLKEIKNLTSNKTIDVELKTTIWQPVANPGKIEDDCLELPGNQGWFKKQKVCSPKEMEESVNLSSGSLLTFTLKNNTGVDYYTYLIDVMDNGKVDPIFPSHRDRQQDARLPAEKEMDLKEKVVLLLNEPGIEMIKLIVTEEPIDINLLKQEKFVKRGSEKGTMNALERLLTTAAHGIRGESVVINRDQWGTLQYSFVVGENASN